MSSYDNHALGKITDFSVITETIRNYTTPASTRIYGLDTNPPSFVSEFGDLIYEPTDVTDLNVYTWMNTPYLKITYGYNKAGNSFGLYFINNISGDGIDSFNDNYSDIQQGYRSKYYFVIVLDVSNARAYILVARKKSTNDLYTNGWRVNVISAMYNGIDLIWESFKNQV